MCCLPGLKTSHVPARLDGVLKTGGKAPLVMTYNDTNDIASGNNSQIAENFRELRRELRRGKYR